ncbi:YkgJ family cysteine cluster protein [Tautonia sociabilis]|uniref:YkgJ family cysteine cluster protein n=1 Tax=Tautonia sociabilis TaxID=2080755 RepID=A0A432MM43_9BACT|nr:YkgJ family cysteine cluster protein [Tautonia sociabilis]RUL88267.1 YkgJ family cysteine cluster protein [Tautonia sociabilis]
MDPQPFGPAESVAALHLDVDRATRPLDLAHLSRLKCGPGCSSCCVDDLTVFPVEADLIRRHHGGLLATGTPHPEGACAFLDAEGTCRIYEHRPYVCRTQGYPLRWVDETEDGSPVELRDICPLNDEPGPPIELLPPELCWTLGPAEARLAALQALASAAGAPPARVRLRDLFDQSPDPKTG